MTFFRAAAVVIGLLAFSAAAPARAADPVTPARGADLARLVRQDCGSCHGMRLAGGLGPALTPDALRDRPREGLVATILHGRRGTPMPPFGPFVNESEAAWIVDRLVEGTIDAPAR